MKEILKRAIDLAPLTHQEALELYRTAPLAELCAAADELRRAKVTDPNVVTWQIDRNVNITNVCISGCKFCNFHCRAAEKQKAFITTIDQYRQKIEQMFALGGDQLLLQGGLHPDLGIEFYEDLFGSLKSLYPTLRLNALGAPEVAYLAHKAKISYEQTLKRLVDAGLDTLPGAGAEILCDRVRARISPAKPDTTQWLEVMRTAHRMNIPTTATMMYGHIETDAERIEHLIKLRDLQAECPTGHRGFVAFIPWIFCSEGTALAAEGVSANFSPAEYLRIIAISRLVLNNIANIQVSWLTSGIPTAQVALHSGANDMGSIMIEENVVSAAGASTRLDANRMQQVILEAGFTPKLRNQLYELR